MTTAKYDNSTIIELSERPTLNAKQTVAALSALAHETRLEAFRLLVQRGPDGLPAGAVADTLKVIPSSLTFHLQQLAHAGLVTQRRVGRQLFYAADFPAMNGLVAYLTENCCGGGAMCGPVCQPARTGTKPQSNRRTA